MPCYISPCLQIHANPDKHEGYGPTPDEPEPLIEGQEPELEAYNGEVKGHWDKRLTSFRKLMFIKVFKEEKVTYYVDNYVLIICQFCYQNRSLIINCGDIFFFLLK